MRKGKQQANKTHVEVGQKIKQAIQEIGGIMKNYSITSLFSGCGGLDLGFHG